MKRYKTFHNIGAGEYEVRQFYSYIIFRDLGVQTYWN